MLSAMPGYAGYAYITPQLKYTIEIAYWQMLFSQSTLCLFNQGLSNEKQ
jgi:hypothetical protein